MGKRGIIVVTVVVKSGMIFSESTQPQGAKERRKTGHVQGAAKYFVCIRKTAFIAVISGDNLGGLIL